MRLRHERGITQAEPARKLGLPQPRFSGYVRGILRLHGQRVVTLARTPWVTADELPGLDPSRNKARVDAPFLRRLRLIDRLPLLVHRAFVRALDAFLERAQLRKTA